ncbi:MAG: hypothetical protein JSW61_10105 [Candidatus Thorarchaeota archaeon]|nr:MAG: hypothetical protein JSW61_10105 [Candidatus Thorarchaeota archaeon]
MNAYFVIVLLSFGLFFLMWSLGWILERLSYRELSTARAHGSRAWQVLVGPGVALHESSHALGCVFTRTPIVEFKPINVSYEGDQVILGYVKHHKPTSSIKSAIISLAPVAVSLVLLTFFALGATYLVPDTPGIGGAGLDLLNDLIFMKDNPVLLADPMYPVEQIGSFIYVFFYTFAELSVVNPIFWIVAFLAMTIMFSNAPSDQDISNASTGIKVIVGFNLVWLVVAYVYPAAGWLLFGLFELLAVMFALGIAFAGVGYGFFFMITAMSKLRTPINLLPFIACIVAGGVLFYQGIGTIAFQTVVSVLVFAALGIMFLLVKSFRRSSYAQQ